MQGAITKGTNPKVVTKKTSKTELAVYKEIWESDHCTSLRPFVPAFIG